MHPQAEDTGGNARPASCGDGLHAGGALGRECGPLVVSREGVTSQSLSACRVAIPGRMTTAALLVRLFAPELTQVVEIPFHRIMEAIRSGEVDAGVIIHESRFTYPNHGLHKVIDLGEWWEDTTGHPLPLGGILARRDLGGDPVWQLGDPLIRLDDALGRVAVL